MRSIKVSDHMVERPVTISARSVVAEAAKVIVENKVSGLIVVDEESSVIGMLSELDCLRSLLAEVYNQGQVGAAPVVSVMTTPVTTASLDGDIISVAESMLSQKQRRRPVVNNGKLEGQVTCRQLLTAILEFGPDSN